MNVECERIEAEKNLCRQLAGNDHKNSKQIKKSLSNEYLLTPEEYKELSVNMDELNFPDFIRGKSSDHNTSIKNYNDNNTTKNYSNPRSSNVQLPI